MTTPLLIGISGASGAAYGVAALKAAKAAGVAVHVVISRTGAITLAHETGLSPRDVEAMADVAYKPEDLAAACSSGSFAMRGMLVAPCSMKSLAEIATGCTTTLITRAAEVTLKERRRLVLMVRETPLILSHIRNMETVTLMGGIIAPPVPALYNKPTSLEEMVAYSVARALDLFDIKVDTKGRWAGL